MMLREIRHTDKTPVRRGKLEEQTESKLTELAPECECKAEGGHLDQKLLYVTETTE